MTDLWSDLEALVKQMHRTADSYAGDGSLPRSYTENELKDFAQKLDALLARHRPTDKENKQ